MAHSLEYDERLNALVEAVRKHERMGGDYEPVRVAFDALRALFNARETEIAALAQNWRDATAWGTTHVLAYEELRGKVQMLVFCLDEGGNGEGWTIEQFLAPVREALHA